MVRELLRIIMRSGLEQRFHRVKEEMKKRPFGIESSNLLKKVFNLSLVGARQHRPVNPP